VPARKKWGSWYHYDTIWCKYGGKCVYMWRNDIWEIQDGGLSPVASNPWHYDKIKYFNEKIYQQFPL